MKNILLMVLVFILNCNQYLTAQSEIHKAHFEITKQTNNTEFKILGLNFTFGNSFLQASDLSTADLKVIRLHEILPSGIYKFTASFDVDLSYKTEFGIGMKNGQETSFYKILIIGDLYRIITPTYTSSLVQFEETTIFNMLKCEDKVDFYVDNTLMHSSGFSSNEDFEAFIKPIDCIAMQAMVQLETIGDCETYDPFGRHSVLHSKLPTIISIARNNVLKFSYIEKYNTEVPEPVSIKIINRAGNTVYNYNNNTPINNQFGLNNHTLNLNPDVFNQDDVYLMTVKGPNKNSTYYLKFKLQ